MNKRMGSLNRKGVSFVEVVVATLVLSLIMVAFIFVRRLAQDTLAVAHHKLVAGYWAQARVEAARADIVTNDHWGAQGWDRTLFTDPSDNNANIVDATKNGTLANEVDTYSIGGRTVYQQTAVLITWTE